MIGKNLIISDKRGGILFTHQDCEELENTEPGFFNILEYLENIDASIKKKNIVSWASNFLDSTIKEQSFTIITGSEKTYRITAQRKKNCFVSYRLRQTKADSEELIYWEISPVQYSSQNEVPRWLNTVPSGVWIYNVLSDKVSYINQYAINIYKYPDSFWYGEGSALAKWEYLLEPYVRDKLICIKNLFFNSKRKSGIFTYKIIDSNGSLRQIEERYFKVFNTDGVFFELIGTVHDISREAEILEKQENLMNEYKQLSELRSNWLKIMAHELRTPLSIINTSTELLKLQLEKHNITCDIVEKNTNRITNQVVKINEIISNLTDNISKTSISSDLTHTSVNLIEIIDSSIQEIFDNQNRSISFVSSVKSLSIYSDRQALSIIINNLLSNAIKFSPLDNDPEVHVQLNSDNDYVLICVKDYGIGIPKNNLNFIFNSFYRASNASHKDGVGLGLSITKNLVELLGGSISVKSKLGEFTEFTVVLPIQSSP